MSAEITSRISRALADSYRIERELGAGGMATVYLAVDLRHDRRVAIKVLRPGLAAALGPARFLEEIRIASRLSHPHILPLHDSGEVDGLLYYVMPFTEGESLQLRVRREGPLPIPEAVALMEDVVDALGFAHRSGVVHRDVKSGNVMMHDGHAMLLDFGVAKALREARAETGIENTVEGMAIGTPEYMAPEQAAADPGVDHRADLYAAGILAFELLTGSTPFAGGTPQAVLTRQITQAVPDLATQRPDVPPSLTAWVAKALEKNPDERWQSAREMLDALAAVDVRDVASEAEPATRRKRPWLHLTAAGIVGVIALLAWSLVGRAEIDETSRAVVDAFENQTGDASLDPVGYMLQDWLTDGLLRSDLLEVVPTITARQAADYIDGLPAGERGDPIGHMSRETRAGIVISGTYYLEGSDLRIQASVTDADHEGGSRVIGRIDPVIGPADDATPLFDDVRNQLLGFLATSLNVRLASQVGSDDRAPTYEAYEALDRGLDLYARRDYADASELFLEAYERDETYLVPLVYASLSLRNHNAWERSDSVVSILEDRRGDLSEYQQHWVDYSRAVLDQDLDEARMRIREAAELAPESKAAYNWALMAVRTGRPSEARDALDSLDPDRGSMRGIPRYWMRRLEASHQLGDHEVELEELEELEARYPGERSVLFYKVRAYAALGWMESLVALLSEAETYLPADVLAIRYRMAAVDLFVHGHRDESAEMARRGIDFIESRAVAGGDAEPFDAALDVLMPTAQLRYQKGRLLEVLGDPLGALEIYEQLHVEHPHFWFFQAHLGVMYASLGRISDARDVDRWLSDFDEPFEEGEITRWRAGIAARLGDHERATALLGQARREGVYWGQLHPVFHLHDAMSDYGPFLELMAPQG